MLYDQAWHEPQSFYKGSLCTGMSCVSYWAQLLLAEVGVSANFCPCWPRAVTFPSLPLKQPELQT
jgi:hypothetical protein